MATLRAGNIIECCGNRLTVQEFHTVRCPTCGKGFVVGDPSAGKLIKDCELPQKWEGLGA